ncbi:Ger(x)C family spore germination protein [Desulforamulus hydrothermalis]|uniref:Germination protein, Ger(X)C family n=1 Tax=Desulforamulus hydrothermalis Lam5 = DSM 18033 TaxID=1121428 RepID=K8DZS7_9FIRM|nr:Ger(x)C family spore germination protein [Desulforamulus hydrothermalis]CCO08555.1 Germination protein, Ger(X)C family [Desulforamulus hydrothermalis Lam5 = DSM 18033]SHH02294.1 spore germination protein KC [Desulforamulus hydrothermalis Lam5 = DSM 18033]
MAVRLARLVLLLFLFANLTGCWDLREAEQTAIVVGFGIDRREDGAIQLVVQTVRPQTVGAAGGGGGSDQPSYHNWYATGATLFDAVRNLALQCPNQFFWSHNQVIIISERLARQGVREVLDFLERDPEFKQSTWLLVARQQSIADILEAGESNRQPPAKALADIINLRQRVAKYAVVNLGDFYQLLESPGQEPHTAGVTFFEGIMKPKEQIAKTVAQASKIFEQHVIDTAVFRGDRLVGWLNPTESRGLLWIKGEVQEGLVVTSYQNKKIVFEILHSTAKIKPQVLDGRLVIKIDIKTHCNLAEASPGIYKLDEAVKKQLEQLVAAQIKQEVMAAVSRCQELNSDAPGFAGAVHRSMPGTWQQGLAEQWPEMFPQLAVQVTVQPVIQGLGLTTTSLNPGQKYR